MKPGADLVFALALALTAHGAAGAYLLAGGGTQSTASEAHRTGAALAPQALGSTLAMWRTPPAVGPSPTRPEAPAEPAPVATPQPSEDTRGHPRQPPGHPQVALPESRVSPPVPPVSARPRLSDIALAAIAAPAEERAPGPEIVEAASKPHRTVKRLDAPGPADTAPDRESPPSALPPVEHPAADTTHPRARPAARAAADVGETGASRAVEAPSPADRRERMARKTASEFGKIEAAWSDAISAKIARAQRHPGQRHGAGRVRVEFVVLRTGRLAGARVVASSGSPGLDRAALDAVRRAAPFPKAPEELPDAAARFGQWVAFR